MPSHPAPDTKLHMPKTLPHVGSGVSNANVSVPASATERYDVTRPALHAHTSESTATMMTLLSTGAYGGWKSAQVHASLITSAIHSRRHRRVAQSMTRPVRRIWPGADAESRLTIGRIRARLALAMKRRGTGAHTTREHRIGDVTAKWQVRRATVRRGVWITTDDA